VRSFRAGIIRASFWRPGIAPNRENDLAQPPVIQIDVHLGGERAGLLHLHRARQLLRGAGLDIEGRVALRTEAAIYPASSARCQTDNPGRSIAVVAERKAQLQCAAGGNNRKFPLRFNQQDHTGSSGAQEKSVGGEAKQTRAAS
jgi:hypothetical protein